MPGENEKVQAFAPQGIENAGVDISFTVPANGWSENSPYTYTWTNSNILSNSRVTVGFASGNSSTDVVYLDCEKVTGGIQLTSSVKPSSALYLVAHIINAKMDSYADVHGDMVATDVITGTSNVDEALENLDTRVATLNSKITTLTELTVTPGANVSFASWGSLTAYKIGRLLLITGYGVRVSSATGLLCTISGITVSKYTSGAGYVEGANSRSFLLTASPSNTNKIDFDGVQNTGSNMFFEFLVFVN